MDAKDTDRLEAFSDGVIAIAITLLVLELRIPEADDGGLWRALLHEWPSFAAYVVSFMTIGIMWVNHHTLFRHVSVFDRPLLFLNLLLLLGIALVPFPTALLARHIRDPIDSHVAAALYSANMSLIAVGFNLTWRWIAHDARLLHEAVDLAAARAASRRYSLGLVVYPVTIALSFVSAPITLAVHGVLAIFYAIDQLPGLTAAGDGVAREEAERPEGEPGRP